MNIFEEFTAYYIKINQEFTKTTQENNLLKARVETLEKELAVLKKQVETNAFKTG